ncbi:unnamed protein product [Penicillium olsonii]|uniref:AMP-activated protein kinase glycogen-binding domain-containing protein n=1 Tax=Penicillium olsonii TaxID=99116 RepID=A0A9W4MRT6_PENOL|nr:unnamed protein product [Penicillium olsonii]CAG8120170.1 unnamed protein product [Penicillium olsonii]
MVCVTPTALVAFYPLRFFLSFPNHSLFSSYIPPEHHGHVYISMVSEGIVIKITGLERPYNASEVFVTGTFDDWGKTVQLDRVGDTFRKTVTISPVQKVHYKFVVDGTWTTDTNVREEDDGQNNINNVLLPEEIETADHSNVAPTMSGVTPDSTTAALAANVPKTNGNLPGTFPDTPGQESEQTLSVDPIPASGGYGNPVKLNPGDKVPHHSELHNNTVDSGVSLDKETYEKGQTLPVDPGNPTDAGKSDAFAFTIPPVTNNMIPESSLPIIGGPAQQAAANETEPIYSGGPAQQAAAADPGYTIQSAGPSSTTAALAANVPLESKGKQANGDQPVEDVPQVVKDSLAEAHQDPEAAANKTAVEEKKDLEKELQKKVDVEESAGTPAPTVTAATQPIAPHLTLGSGVDSADVSPTSTPPPGRNAAAAIPTSQPKTTEPSTESTGPTVTTGPETTSTAETTTAKPAPTGPTVTTGPETTSTAETTTAKPAPTVSTGDSAPAASETKADKPAQSPSTENASTNGSKSDKKKKRLSSFFSKLKEKLK